MFSQSGQKSVCRIFPARGGVKSHYGFIEDKVVNIFDGSDLYLVSSQGKIITLEPGMIQRRKKDTKTLQRKPNL